MDLFDWLLVEVVGMKIFGKNYWSVIDIQRKNMLKVKNQ